MKIFTLGGATQDIFVEFAAESKNLETAQGTQTFVVLPEGKKIEVQQVDYYTGGGATNSAASFKHFGFDVESFFKIGADTQGSYILEELKRLDIVTDTVVRTTNIATAVSVVIPAPSGDRTVLTYRGANATLTEQDLPLQHIKSADQLYVTSLSSTAGALIIPITKAAHDNGVPVAVNPGSSQLKAGAEHLRTALRTIDILILNGYEATLLMASCVATNEHLKKIVAATDKHATLSDVPKLMQTPMSYNNIYFNLTDFFKEILSQGPEIVVVTDGAQGVYVATHEAILFHPALPTAVISSVGAGDAFGSTFVASVRKGLSLETAMRYGIINAASVIGHVDAKTGLLPQEELERRAAGLDAKLLQKIALT